jgi:hypothetical protein
LAIIYKSNQEAKKGSMILDRQSAFLEMQILAKSLFTIEKNHSKLTLDNIDFAKHKSWHFQPSNEM